MTCTLLLGDAAGRQVRVRVISRAYPGGLWVFDRGWLFAELAARGPESTWRSHAFLRAEDFAEFTNALDQLATGQGDHATFEPRDPWLTIRVQRQGHEVTATVRARDQHTEHAIAFDWALTDETMPALRAAISAVATAFPVLP